MCFMILGIVWHETLAPCGECNQSSGRSWTAWRAEDVEKETGGHFFRRLYSSNLNWERLVYIYGSQL